MRMACCWWLVCSAFLVLAAVAGPSLGQPIQDSDLGDMPERLRELLLIRRLVSNLNSAEAAIPDALPGIRGQSYLEHELEQLAKASAAAIDFRGLRVSRRAIRSYCSTNPDRQCRSFCFNLGDAACAEGDIGGNGEDSHFLASGNTPGK